NLKMLKGGIDNKQQAGIILDDSTLDLSNSKTHSLERRFRITVLDADLKNKKLSIRLWIDTPDPTKKSTHTQLQEFWIGLFDFPAIDSIRLSEDTRCAVVLTDFNTEEEVAQITFIYFPGSYASLKE